MKRLPLFVLVATIAIVVAVGGALATTHGTQTSGPEPKIAVTTAAAAPLAADVPLGRPKTRVSATPPKATAKPKPATHAASTAAKGRTKDCWDDCADPGESNCGSAAGGNHPSTGVVDDDGDGDGGDCGGEN